MESETIGQKHALTSNAERDDERGEQDVVRGRCGEQGGIDVPSRDQ